MKGFGGSLALTEVQVRKVLKNMDWMKKEGTAGKVGPCAKFLEEDKFSFQRAISKFVLEHDIPLDLLLNPLSASAALT